MNRIRSYRKPIPNTDYRPISPDHCPDQPLCKDMFVLMEAPLLEVDHEDLLFLKGCGISAVNY